MFEQKHNKVLRDAASRFPEGCLCEDCGVCAYCRFILNYLDKRSMNFKSPSEEPHDSTFLENTRFKIPSGSSAQIYELRRVFRLCK